AWRRGAAIGEILLSSRLSPRLLRSIAGQYAQVADAHMQHALTLDAWQHALGRVRRDGTIPRQVALDLFALAYAPLPGTERPPGAYRAPEDAFVAEQAILRYWSTLTPAQQASAAAALGVAGVRLRGKALRGASAVRGGTTYGDPLFVEDDGLEKVA